MASRNELLGQMQRPPSPEERVRELNSLRRGVPHLSQKQEIRLEELEQWHEDYLEEQRTSFRKWAFHPTLGGKVFESEDEWNEAIENGWYDALWKANEAKSPQGRQRIIESEFKEEIVEETKEDHRDYLIFLKRIIPRSSGPKHLYSYTLEELREVYNKLDLPFDESKSRVDIYKNLKKYIELNT